ncbi:MAG: hypothetical protein AB7G80_03225 [Dongiaceae bacterium]
MAQVKNLGILAAGTIAAGQLGGCNTVQDYTTGTAREVQSVVAGNPENFKYEDVGAVILQVQPSGIASYKAFVIGQNSANGQTLLLVSTKDLNWQREAELQKISAKTGERAGFNGLFNESTSFALPFMRQVTDAEKEQAAAEIKQELEKARTLALDPDSANSTSRVFLFTVSSNWFTPVLNKPGEVAVQLRNPIAPKGQDLAKQIDQITQFLFPMDGTSRDIAKLNRQPSVTDNPKLDAALANNRANQRGSR